MSLLHLGFGRLVTRSEVIGIFEPGTVTERPTHTRPGGGEATTLRTQGAPRGLKVQSWVLTSERLIASPIRSATLYERMEQPLEALAGLSETVDGPDEVVVQDADGGETIVSL